MFEESARIIGRVVASKEECNYLFPKFTLKEYPDREPLEEIIESPDALDQVPTGEKVYEPTHSGLGTLSDTMYVITRDTTYLFHYSLDSQHITWGSWVVTFNDPVTLGGQLL